LGSGNHFIDILEVEEIFDKVKRATKPKPSPKTNWLKKIEENRAPSSLANSPSEAERKIKTLISLKQ